MDKWIKKDLKYIWHPYTQMKDCIQVPPLLITKAKRSKIYDAGGNFYYDTISSWWCNVHGHNHPKINAAIRGQLRDFGHILFAGFTHKPAISLAEKIISLAPENLTKVFFSDNGSCAVETALKMAFQYWHNAGKKKKTKFIALDYGYHGDTLGAMSVSGVDLFNEKFSPLLFGCLKVPSPYCYRCPAGKKRDNCGLECALALEDVLRKRADEVAAIILEPLVLGAGGMIVYPKQYLKKVASIAKAHNVLLILDEVATGFGRTGKMFACEHIDGVTADFLCLSKGLTSGYLPLAMTLTSDKIYNSFYAEYKDRKTFYHGHTYTANPIACSAALASLAIFEEERTLEHVKRVVPVFEQGLGRFRDLRLVGDIRHIGLVGAIELVKNKQTKQKFNFEERIGLEVYKKGIKKNLILRPLGDITYLFLPLCIKIPEVEDILKRLYSVIESLS